MPIFLDTSVFVALATHDSGALEICRQLANSRFDLYCTDTVLQELGFLVQENGILSDDIAVGLSIMKKQWRVSPLALEETRNWVAEKVATNLLDQFKHYHDGLKLNDCLKIAEAAVPEGKFHVMMSWQQELLRLPHEKVCFSLAEADLHPVIVMSPSEVLKLLLG